MEINIKFVQWKKYELCKGNARWSVEPNDESTLYSIDNFRENWDYI
jgi:hypothetical protein